MLSKIKKAINTTPYFETENGILYNSDCLKILPQMPDGIIDLCLTDPPYNAKKDYGKFKDDLPEPEYEKWMTSCFALSSKIAENQAWIAPRYKMNFFTSLMPKAHMIVVRRGARGPFRQGWSDQFETILTIGKPNKCDVDLWDDIRLKGEGYFFRENTFGHPGYTPFPIIFRLVHLLSKTSVCDIFMGLWHNSNSL